MNKDFVLNALKENLFMLRDANTTTITDKARKSLTTSIEAAIMLLENKGPAEISYPENLLLDLYMIATENERSLYKKILKKALETLSETEKDLIIKRYLQNKELKEISKETGISESSLEDLYGDIKGNLKKEIESIYKAKEERPETSEDTPKKNDIAEALSGDIDLLGLSPRSGNALKRAGYMKIKDLNGISEDALKNVKGLGKESYMEVMEKAKTMGLRIKKK